MAQGRETTFSPPIVLAADMALFLDVDGTLLDIAPTPAAVRVPDDLGATLGRIAERLGGALAIVSGRPIAMLDRLFPDLACAAAGQHGAELRLPSGATELLGGVAPLPDRIADGLDGLARRWPAILVEPKGFSIALHYRAAPELEPELEAALEELLAPDRAVVALKRGKFVFELAPRHVDKGKAVERLMALPPFVGRRPVFIGDDVTDEDGFAAVTRLGGIALRVGAGGEGRYDGRFEDPTELRAWLTATIASGPRDARGGRP
jgi:trehalose 6-phosphate phosphatase